MTSSTKMMKTKKMVKMIKGRVLFLIGFILLFIPGLSVRAASSCGSVAEVWNEYRSGRASEAIEKLRCITAENPQDIESARLLSDMQWWEGDVGASQATALSALGTLGAEQADPWGANPFHLRRRLQDFRLSGDFASIQSKYNTGAEARLEGEVRYWRKNRLRAGVYRLARVYQDGTELKDWVYRFGHSSTLGTAGYLDASAEFSRDPIFSPKTRLDLEPHFNLPGDAEIYSGIRLNHYATADILEARLGLVYPWSEDLKFGAKIGGVSMDGLLLSGAGFADLKVVSRLQVRAGVGAGKTLEDVDTVSGYKSIDVSASWLLQPGFALRAGGGAYGSDVRNETRATVGFDLFF